MQFWWGGQMGMARSASRSRSLSLRHTKISLTLTKSVLLLLDLTVICIGDCLLTQEIPNPRLTPQPELRSKFGTEPYRKAPPLVALLSTRLLASSLPALCATSKIPPRSPASIVHLLPEFPAHAPTVMDAIAHAHNN